MAQTGSGGGCGAGDFHLPDEILAVIPTDPYEQLDLARKITSMAIASRVSQLESENGTLRQKVADKDRAVADLEDRLAHLERAFRDADARLRGALEENIKLAKERDSVLLTSKKLARDLVKLETFKRHLMQSLSEDNQSQPETVFIQTYDQPISKDPATKDEGSIDHAASNVVNGSTDLRSAVQEASRLASQKSSVSPFITPRLTPTVTQKVQSTGASPRSYSTASSPKLTSGATSPARARYEAHTAMTPWYPARERSSAANSPPRGLLPGRTPRIDGKEFFRQARSRLSCEQFGTFLANIKELNAHRQTREETLRKAEEIFGADNKDLYMSFQGLLNRSLP